MQTRLLQRVYRTGKVPKLQQTSINPVRSKLSDAELPEIADYQVIRI